VADGLEQCEPEQLLASYGDAGTQSTGTSWLILGTFAVVFLVGAALSDTSHALIALLILVASYPLYRGTRMLIRAAE